MIYISYLSFIIESNSSHGNIVRKNLKKNSEVNSNLKNLNLSFKRKKKKKLDK